MPHRVRMAGPRRSTILGRCALLLLICLLSGCRLFRADPRVAFLGDSLTEGWAYPRANFGHYGDTTAQILSRTTAALQPGRYKRVVILGGTNDLLTGVDPEVTIRNLESIAILAKEAGAEPVLCEVPPIFHNYNRSDTTDYSIKVRDLNRRLVELGARRKWQLVDYYDPLLGHPDFSSDGVHMKRRGYLTMEAALLRAAPDI